MCPRPRGKTLGSSTPIESTDSVAPVPSSPLQSLFLSLLLPRGLSSPSQYRARLGYQVGGIAILCSFRWEGRRPLISGFFFLILNQRFLINK